MNLILFVRHLQVIDQVHVLDDAHLLFGGRDTAFVLVVEVFGHRIGYVVIQVEVAEVGHPGAVGCFVVNEEAERFLFVADAVHPVYGQVGHDVGGVSFALHPFSVLDELGVVVVALAYQDVPVVKAGRFRDKVPLADHGGLVSVGLQ